MQPKRPDKPKPSYSRPIAGGGPGIAFVGDGPEPPWIAGGGPAPAPVLDLWALNLDDNFTPYPTQRISRFRDDLYIPHVAIKKDETGREIPPKYPKTRQTAYEWQHAYSIKLQHRQRQLHQQEVIKKEKALTMNKEEHKMNVHDKPNHRFKKVVRYSKGTKEK